MPRIPRPGDQLGPYRVTRQLGAGGMGVVFEAVEEGLGRRVALKVLAVQLAEEPEFRARFAREATVLARSDSPHIIQVYSHGEQDGCLYLATQFVPGGDLAARVEEEGVPGRDVAIDVTAQIAWALADAHAVGVVHRDVKPQNVLLRPGPGQPHAYLCDFGIARDDESSLTGTGVVAGTYAYLAPERFRGEPATPASDIYALGCLLWFLLTGKAPYDGGLVQLAQQHELAPVPQLPDPSDRLNGFLRRAMAKDPLARHASAAEAAAELRAIRAGGRQETRHLVAPVASSPSTEPVPLPPAPPPVQPDHRIDSSPPDSRDHPGRSRRPRTPLVAALAVLAVLGLGVGGAVAWNALRADDDPDRAATDRSDGSGGPGTTTSPYTRADVDGDGADDTILLDRAAGEALVLASTSDGFADPVRWAGTGYDDARVVRGDFTGDGLTDLAVVGGGEVEVARSTGSEFAAAEDWGVTDLPEKLKVTAGDVDGDGRTDLVLWAEAGPDEVDVSVAVSDGSSFAAPSRWGTVSGWALADLKVAAGDLDGDGAADLVGLGAAPGGGIEIQVLTSTGTELEDQERWFSRSDWEWRGTHLMVGDYDGDDDADLLAMRDLGHAGFVVLRSDGTSLTTGRSDELPDLSFDDLSPVSADTDGDGSSDLVLLDRAAGEVRQLRFEGSRLVGSGRAAVPGDAREAILVGITR